MIKLKTLTSLFQDPSSILQPTTSFLALLESFKEHQISKVIESINTKFFDAIKSPHFNSKMKEYFKNIQSNGEPFTHFEKEPDNVTQIKKILNALYHARLAFLDVEKLDANWMTQGLNNGLLLYRNTIHHAYMACHLITHLDVDLRGIFNEEIKLILPFIAKFQDFSTDHSAETKELAISLKNYPISYNTGWATGITIDKMQAKPGSDVDYSSLTQFGGLLPGYIDDFTKEVQKYSSEFIKKESTLNQEKISKIQDAAKDLLARLDNLKGDDFVISLKFLNYVHIIHHVITLSVSTLEQMHNLSDSSQDVIRDHLAQLKYKVLPTLFGLVDKIEVHCMLNPGTLSAPLMEKIKTLYDLLIHYASKPVDFNKKGEELLCIEDSRFISARLALTYKRIDEANKLKFKTQQASEALNKFYDILNQPEWQNLCLHELPRHIKSELIFHYKIICPYMATVDIDLNDILIDSLQQDTETWSAYFSKPWQWVKGEVPTDHITKIIKRKTDLLTLLKKKQETHQFHIQLNEDIIHSVHQKAEIALFPYTKQDNIFTVDESRAFDAPEKALQKFIFVDNNKDKFLENVHQLSCSQALDLHQWYKNKHNKFINAQEAYSEFITRLNDLSKDHTLNQEQINTDDKKYLASLYNRFQPYFIHAIPPDQEVSALHFDKQLVYWLSENSASTDTLSFEFFNSLRPVLETYFKKTDSKWRQASEFFLKIAQEKSTAENNAALLEHDQSIGSRAHFVIQHTNYSKSIHEFRHALHDITDFLSDTIKKEITSKSGPDELPYPELEQYNTTLAQNKKMVALKRLFNSVFYLESFFHQLEALDNNDWQTTYIHHVAKAYYQLHKINKEIKQIAKDPYFTIMGKDMLNKAQALFATIQEHSAIYQTTADQVPYDAPVKYHGIWYAINAFYISPEHIKIFSENHYLTTEEIDNAQIKAKKAVLKIESIINSSSSYFKLFLQVPTMYNLYKELKNKLHEFTGTTHDAVMENLGQIQSKIITSMLLEADHWENQLGLKPGSLSNTLKNITDEFFKGFLEPMGLHSQKHLALLCDQEPITQRINAIYKKIDQEMAQLDAIHDDYAVLEQLFELFNQYEQLTTGYIPASELAIKISQNELISAYHKALPKLVALQKIIQMPSGNKTKDSPMDALLNASSKDYEPKLFNIRTFAISCYHYYLGLKATHLSELQTTQEKLSHLLDVKQEQEQQNLLSIKQYTEQSFTRQMEAFCNRQLGLQFTDKEYRAKLKTYLIDFKNNMMAEAQKAEDINLTLKHLLQEKIQLFEKEHFANYYHLDSVRAALVQFKVYLSRTTLELENSSSYSEDQKTIRIKNKLINEQDEIASNEQLSIEQRIEKIKINVTTNHFKKSILKQKTYDYFCLSYLIQCFLSLFETLHLYTPERAKLLNTIYDTVNKEPEINELGHRFGLFSRPEKKNTPPEEHPFDSNLAMLST